MPLSTIKANKIHSLPIKIRHKNKSFLDDRSVKSYQKTVNILRHTSSIKTEPCSSIEIKEFLISLFSKYDYVLFILPMQSRSISYQNTLAAINNSIDEINKIRRNKNIPTNIIIEIIDSKQLSVGVGALLNYGINLINEGLSFDTSIKHLHTVLECIQTYVVPNNLSHLYTQGSKKGDKSVGLGALLLGNALDIKPIVFIHDNNSETIDKAIGFDNAVNKVLDIVIEQIRRDKLLAKYVNISYGNTLQQLKDKSKYKELEKLATQYGIKILLSNMTATLNVNVGLGSFAISFFSDSVLND
ncbi:DegV family EDD domain-containing protein [archaeon]|nr:DegV family EDD domain-containing protein [archaeon]